MKFVEYADADMMFLALADVIAGSLENHLFSEETATLVVPGGTTPGPIFDSLSATAHLDWSRINVLLSDERWVPLDSPRSNTKLLKDRLLTGPAAAARYVPLFCDAADPSAGALALGPSVEDVLPITVLVLGMGADMHTASLFPNSPQLAGALDPKAPAVVAVDVPDQPEDRVSLSASVLRGAISTHIVIKGADKRAAVERAQHLDEMAAPIQTVLSSATVHWAES
ncbi:6-phosphogluconolactonase [Algirhabdus cladophorae]|uniref:6-phosphogluconolactonase n=1 Tax=Algirhabdus cladophorae TaxID=3377108 RepID=UPI003B847A0F